MVPPAAMDTAVLRAARTHRTSARGSLLAAVLVYKGLVPAGRSSSGPRTVGQFQHCLREALIFLWK